MNMPDALNPVAYLRELRLLIRELRGGVTSDQLFNIVLTTFVFAIAALVRDDLPFLAILFMVLFAGFCFWQVSKANRKDTH